MHLDHINDFQNSMKRRLRSGITPAQFELDALRGDEMLLRVQMNAALRAADASTTDIRPLRTWMSFKIALLQFGHLVTPWKHSDI